MARIAGINIPMNKHVWVGLTHIYGVGRSQARKACAGAGVKPETKVKDLTEAEVTALRTQVGRLTVEDRFLPILQHVALSNAHIHDPVTAPFSLLEFAPLDPGGAAVRHGTGVIAPLHV